MKKFIEECIKNNLSQLIEGMRIISNDPHLVSHSKKVAYYSICIFNSMQDLKKDSKDYNALFCSAFLHDLGKTSISSDILQKRSSLTPNEYEIIKSHPKEGKNILSRLSFSEDITKAVLHHHERYDGNGYPYGLKNGDIPLLSRIISITDSFDAMTSFRCYRKTLSKEYALGELLENAGTQFDPYITSIFIKLIQSGNIQLGWEFNF